MEGITLLEEAGHYHQEGQQRFGRGSDVGEDYVFKVMQHLDNVREYRRLDEDPTERFAAEISLFLRDMRSCRVIDEETMKGLLPENPRSPSFTSCPRSINWGAREDP